MTTHPARADGAEAGAPAATPWWRVGMVWLVLGGPLLVVVAGIGTAVIAHRGADEVLSRPADNPAAVRPSGQTPALQARNHAATAQSAAASAPR